MTTRREDIREEILNVFRELTGTPKSVTLADGTRFSLAGAKDEVVRFDYGGGDALSAAHDFVDVVKSWEPIEGIPLKKVDTGDQFGLLFEGDDNHHRREGPYWIITHVWIDHPRAELVITTRNNDYRISGPWFTKMGRLETPIIVPNHINVYLKLKVGELYVPPIPIGVRGFFTW